MSEQSSWRDWGSSRPMAVEGGIKAKSKRGAIGEQWWSRRFIAVLDSYGMSSRLQRGRAYARRGQVVEFAMAPGVVAAYVQGSRPEPYLVTIKVRPLTAAQWRAVESRLASQALFRARLLAGEMPAEIEEVFAACGTPLFPATASDLAMSCNCPDWGMPCKHLAAVCYVLAEAFDADPFAMLAWRGQGRDDLLATLRARAGANRAGPTQAGPLPDGARQEVTGTSHAAAVLADVTGTPLADTLADFWSPGLTQARLRALPASPVTPPDLLLRVSDPPPVTVRGKDLREVLHAAYERLGRDADSESAPPTP